MRRGQGFESSFQGERSAAADMPMSSHLGRLPFAQRLTCTVAEACEATGLGRTKIYELIGDGRVTTTTVGRRRLVNVLVWTASHPHGSMALSASQLDERKSDEHSRSYRYGYF
ncbi:excisionase family DNA-binding protein [Bradyrhizobium sp. TM239]|uniref:excisionase family DNA-binding protein n=1 Tax=Bradyrhizobium sp. TM239 TaxID=2599802 RepID=UPI0027D598CD|nr:hypothetical protein TM239_00990 [Bradyrhizobium sp. TM239]